MPVAYLPDLLSHLAAPRVLELGGRRVTPDPWQPPAHWLRLGVDVRPGPGVDLVADAHTLSTRLPHAGFHAIYSHAVFEHLAMPWRVVLEMNRLLEPGGLAWVVTHEAFPVHEWPSDFWRFGPGAWRALFHPGTGFEVLGERPLQPARVIPDGDPAGAFAGHLGCEVQVRKLGDPDPDCRWDVSPAEALSRARVYPGRGRATYARARRLARRLVDRLGLSQPPRPSVDDPWSLFGRQQRWHLLAGPSARPVPGERLPWSGTLRESLSGVPDGALENLALLDVLHREPAPWAAVSHARRVLRDGGRLYVDDCQVAPADEPCWRMTSAALPVLLHDASGFRLLRRAMLDPCAVLGEGITERVVDRAYRRTLGLARAAGPFDHTRLAWPW